NDAQVREMTCGYTKGVDGINTITHVDVGDGVPHSSPSSRRSLTYLAMICGVMCGMPLSGPTFASWTATGNRSVGAIDPLIGFSGFWYLCSSGSSELLRCRSGRARR